MYYIYEITNNLNGKTYIGQRKCPDNKTPTTDLYMGSGVILKEAESKYGISNFSKKILKTTKTKEEADTLEKYFIKEYRKNGKAEYNIADGGQGGAPNRGKIFDKTWRKHISESSAFATLYFRVYKNFTIGTVIKNNKCHFMLTHFDNKEKDIDKFISEQEALDFIKKLRQPKKILKQRIMLSEEERSFFKLERISLDGLEHIDISLTPLDEDYNPNGFFKWTCCQGHINISEFYSFISNTHKFCNECNCECKVINILEEI